MVKRTMAGKRKMNVKRKPKVKVSPKPALAPFKGVTQVELAPVSIGNTVRSVGQTVIPTVDGVRVVGRDYIQTVGGTGTAYSGWCLQGGFALSPIAMNATGLRGFFQSYEKYKWKRADAHYITSSPTALSGDILIVYHQNHGGPKVNHTSNNFLSYALSTDSALIGPQWTNHSAGLIQGEHKWFSTDVLNTEDVVHQADGEVLVYTKNTTNGASPDSPGYLLLDYDICFEGRMLNPRVNILPSSLYKWFPTGINTNAAPTTGDVVTFTTNTISAYTGLVVGMPPGVEAGMVFQIVLDLSNAVIAGGINLSTAFGVVVNYTGTGATSGFTTLPYAMTTGATLYAVCGSAAGFGAFALFPDYASVFAGNALRWTLTSGAAGFTAAMAMCCVGSVTPAYLQASIG